MKRTFIAIPVEAGAPLKQFTERMRAQFRGENISWVEPVNFHVTVRFLGDTPDEMMAPITEAMRRTCHGCHIGRGMVRGLGYFSFKGVPSVLYARIEGWEGAPRLADLLERELETLGFAPGNHAFKAHLTLARIKNLYEKKRFKEIIHSVEQEEFQEAKASRIILYESILQPRGPIYKPLAVTPLKMED